MGWLGTMTKPPGVVKGSPAGGFPLAAEGARFDAGRS